MATAYAALISVMNVLTRIQHPSCPVSFDKSQIQSLSDKLNSLVDFLEIYSQRISKDLQRKMADAAFSVEDVIESFYVDPTLARSTDNKQMGSDLESSIQMMDLIVQEIIQVKDRITSEPDSWLPPARVRSVLPTSGMDKMVGFDEELLRLMDQLTSYQSSRQIIPIVGMGGIGKTTLARNVYEHPYVKHHFDVRAWVTISEHNSIDKIIQSILCDIPVDVDQSSDEETWEEQLYKGLYGRKYLIVLDDIWDNSVWYEMSRFFPDNSNGSRILLTTRLSDVALSVASCSPYEIKLRDESKSWDLLYQTVFGEEICPPELIGWGKKIAKSCKGLPLAIVVIGGLLKMSCKTVGYWESVAENVNSFINAEKDGHCFQILSLSYSHLPVHLKPCFLHIATFHEDTDLDVSFIMSLWVVEGFLKPSQHKTLEEVALDCLNDLISRNLIMVTRRGPAGRILSCTFHDLLRDFCLRQAHDEGFLCQVKEDILELPAPNLENERRLVYHPRGKGFYDWMSSVPLARSLVSASGPLDFTSCRLLRVLVMVSSDIVDVTHLVNLRYLACEVDYVDASRLFPYMSLFWNLETLNLLGDHLTSLPPEIWELPNLRHLMSEGLIVLPDTTDAQKNCVLNNLQTLSKVWNFDFTDEVLAKIPNLITLRFSYELDFSLEVLDLISCYFSNLACLGKLENLTCHFDKGLKVFNRHTRGCTWPENLTFSHNLRELTLQGSDIPWEYMNTIGSLPHLEVLILLKDAFYGDEWNSTEEDFQSLKFLSIRSCSILIWRAEHYHFPRLQCLELLYLDLEEIPLGIGEVASLQSIKLITNDMSAVISATKILDERHSQGDDDLLITGCYIGQPGEEKELENFASHNFQIEFEPYMFRPYGDK